MRDEALAEEADAEEALGQGQDWCAGWQERWLHSAEAAASADVIER